MIKGLRLNVDAHVGGCGDRDVGKTFELRSRIHHNLGRYPVLVCESGDGLGAMFRCTPIHHLNVTKVRGKVSEE